MTTLLDNFVVQSLTKQGLNIFSRGFLNVCIVNSNTLFLFLMHLSVQNEQQSVSHIMTDISVSGVKTANKNMPTDYYDPMRTNFAFKVRRLI